MRIGTYRISRSSDWRASLLVTPDTVLDLADAAKALNRPVPLANDWRPPTDVVNWITPEGIGLARAILAASDGGLMGEHVRALASVEHGPPMPRPGKFIAVGRNYMNHVREGQKIWAARGKVVALPTFPASFVKFAACCPACVITHDSFRRYSPGRTVSGHWKMSDYSARIANTAEELAQILLPIAAAGASMFHASTRRFWEPAFSGSDENLAACARRLTGKPVIAVGSVGLAQQHETRRLRTRDNMGSEIAGLERLLECLERDDFDVVAVGRGMIADPQWAEKVRNGRTENLNPLSPDMLEDLR